MTSLDLSEVIPAKRSAEPGPERLGIDVSMSEYRRDLGSPVPDLRFALIRDDNRGIVPTICKSLTCIDPRHKAEDDDG
jgi:hypothetical protein